MSIWRYDAQTGHLTSHCGPALSMSLGLLAATAVSRFSVVAGVLVGVLAIVGPLVHAHLQFRKASGRAAQEESGETR
ncbi:hypothetical protein SAMN05216550_123102 [Paraburkholderia tropica]|uniref:Uncharacterized protein n=1 Tax=Paraburkholderia tropica TaxID=92647 RepID=A0AAQ1JXQ0_9BURK|nr:hypothetical protein SAMN05216550_123102 [Paraburkholderia tropica]